MAKIYVLMGKSASGKDTLYNQLLQTEALHLKRIILYTTRPIRTGEENGREYYFVSQERFYEMENAGQVVECRTYQTVHGPWHYFTAADEQINLAGTQNYLMINTLEGYCRLVQYFGQDYVVPLYIEVEDGLRLERALSRERQQAQPKYEEMCRRFLADARDFSPEKLAEAGIVETYPNLDAGECFTALKQKLQSCIS
ncbi:MAG: guanylate kinase [Lachnospiraceae bacterium]|nr:guanylate kinase [Lachnospiraceae bacterium]